MDLQLEDIVIHRKMAQFILIERTQYSRPTGSNKCTKPGFPESQDTKSGNGGCEDTKPHGKLVDQVEDLQSCISVWDYALFLHCVTLT